MRIYYPEDLFDILKDKHLLLDTNVFIDSFNFDKPIEYIEFFNQLKDNNTTLTTIDGVIFEFLKGSKNNKVYLEKEEHINDIIDYTLPPPTKTINKYISELIKLYGPDGGTLQMIDYHLGAMLLQYKSNLLLLTRDLQDFSQKIFSLKSSVSFPTGKTIFTYGIYTSEDKNKKTESNIENIPF